MRDGRSQREAERISPRLVRDVLQIEGVADELRPTSHGGIRCWRRRWRQWRRWRWRLGRRRTGRRRTERRLQSLFAAAADHRHVFERARRPSVACTDAVRAHELSASDRGVYRTECSEKWIRKTTRVGARPVSLTSDRRRCRGAHRGGELPGHARGRVARVVGKHAAVRGRLRRVVRGRGAADDRTHVALIQGGWWWGW